MIVSLARGMAGRVAACVILCAVAACDRPPETQPREARRTPVGVEGPVSVRVGGVVTLEGRDDAEGVQVYIPGTARVSITGPDGRYLLEGVGEGTWTVMARREGFRTTEVSEVVVEPDTPPGRQLVLPAATLAPAAVARTRSAPSTATAAATAELFGTLTGQVVPGVSENAPPVPPIMTRCTVELRDTPYRTQCDSDGLFMLWNIPVGAYTLLARMPGFETHTRLVQVEPGMRDVPLSVELEPRVEVRDRTLAGMIELFEADGSPSNAFERITVQVYMLGGEDQQLRDLPTPTLGPDGSFTMANLVPGRYLVTAFGDGYELTSAVEADLTEATRRQLRLTLRGTAPPRAESATLTGAVILDDPEATDFAGVQVALAGTGYTALTDAGGNYTIRNVPPGSYQLIAEADGFEPGRLGPFEVEAGETLELEDLLLAPELDYPVVLSTRPGDGARDVLVEPEVVIEVRFNKKMDPDSLRRAVSIRPPVLFEVFAGRERRDTDFDLMQIVLYGTATGARGRSSESPPMLEFKTRYTIRIGREARDVEGLELAEPYEMSVTTGEPAVIATNPPDDGFKRDLSPRDPLVIYFNAPMDHETLTERVLSFRPRLTASPNISAREDPQTGWTHMTVSTLWEADTEYEVTVQRRARTAGRQSLSNTPYRFSFRTSPRFESQPDGSIR